jgi:uncharacterized protein with NAD-binding domain and iron-sulfur cluster
VSGVEGRVKVAIVGGGCAAITTAFELSRPEHDNRYDITVYQRGWRLGGKGASGRGPADRIEEHGLHLWMGFYDNAFHLMRACYAELDRDPRTSPIADWTDAFVPAPYVGLTDPASDGKWHHLLAHFPPLPGLPGDPRDGVPATMLGYLTRAITLLSALLESARSTADDIVEERERNSGFAPGRSSDGLVEEVQRWLHYGQLATMTGILQGVHLLEGLVQAVPLASYELLAKVLEGVANGLKRVIDAMLEADDESRYVWEIIDLVLADIRGTIKFGLLTDPRGLDAINDYDAREWLLLCGASPRSVNSTIMRGLYDLAFAYEDGDPDKPRIAAGQALRGGMRMFLGYRGALFWKMQAGMGDIVFSPLYEVLKRRGVRFEFFHRLTNVGIAEPALDHEHAYVDRLEFDVQAHVVGGGEYAPLVEVDGLPCWPSAPDWQQLERGDELNAEGREFESAWDRRAEANKTLLVSKDFDFVVLGVSVGAVTDTCAEILARDARWRDMVRHVKTVPTQAFQVWLKEDMEALGWHKPPPNVSGFVEPFDTWADMTHLIPAERWDRAPKALAYFCNVLAPDPGLDRERPDYPHLMRERVKTNAVDFLNRDIVHLWSKAQSGPETFRWELLADPADSGNEPTPAVDEQRFDSQFWIANVNPSDQYVLSLPGSLRYRISPLDGTYDNLTITGDWTECGFNYGCVESAVMAGRLAAHALSRLPRLEDIFAYDHP